MGDDDQVAVGGIIVDRNAATSTKGAEQELGFGHFSGGLVKQRVVQLVCRAIVKVKDEMDWVCAGYLSRAGTKQGKPFSCVSFQSTGL